MSRKRYLVAYDIADPKRLRSICALMEEYGQRLQYSVFLCDLSAAEHNELENKAVAIINLAEDSIVQIDLGPTTSPRPIRALGRRRRLPTTGPMIV